ncbi:MAG: hypothetical protein AAGN64_02540 [Bacteroidota bacterium]
MAAASMDHDMLHELEEVYDRAIEELGLRPIDSAEEAALALLREPCRLFLAGEMSRKGFLNTVNELRCTYDSKVFWGFEMAVCTGDANYMNSEILEAERLLRDAFSRVQAGNPE